MVRWSYFWVVVVLCGTSSQSSAVEDIVDDPIETNHGSATNFSHLRDHNSSRQHRHLSVMRSLFGVFQKLSIRSAEVEKDEYYPSYAFCGCDDCTDQVWNTIIDSNNGDTCGDKITYLQEQESDLFPTEYDSCHRIGAIEYPAQCGACNPDTCDGRVSKRSPQDDTPPDYFCDCPGCTEDVWRQDIEPDRSCASFVTWAALTADTIQDACTTMAWQYPDSECARRCDCRPKCECLSCTQQVLDRVAIGSDGVQATCGERIAFLQTFEGGNLSPFEACRRVAGDPMEFPDVCGPCNPSVCNAVDVPSLPTILIPTPPIAPRPTPRSDFGSKPSPPRAPRPTPPVGFGSRRSPPGGPAPTPPRNPTPTPPVNPTPTPPVNPTPTPPVNPTPTPPRGPTPSPPCGCTSCTSSVLDRLAMGADGVVASCGARMRFVQMVENGGLAETAACQLVAGEEFPAVCGACDPMSCNGGGREPDTRPRNVNRELGNNVITFGPTTSPAEIQATFDSIRNQQVDNEMGSERYSLYFLPGVYGSPSDPLQLQIGYYTEVAGLGEDPSDVVIHGKIEVYNRCFAEDPYNAGQFIPASREAGGICFALNNFWRSLANLSIQIAHRPGTDDCRIQAMFWAISQASSMRRVLITGGDVSLMDFCAHTNGVDGFASGGFIADSKHTGGKIINGSQQQFLTRNMDIEQWDGAVWNSVFVGVQGAPNDATYPDPPFTTIARTPLSREKPYLFVDGNGQYNVRKQHARFETSGTSWEVDGATIPLSDFFVAVPGVSAGEINMALASGQHLLLTPGVYELYGSITVASSDTVVLGLGHATLRPMNGSVALKIASGVEGVVVSGVTLDGGPVLSPVLFQVGDINDRQRANPNNPVTLHDIYFRIGGPYIGKATVCLEINSPNVLVDHAWVWRADHGIEAFDKNDGFDGDNERWRTNIGTVGMVVNGHDVTATGLFVEHYQQHNLIWNGERGRVYFFQNELPYDPPSQADWDGNSATSGWAGYKVNERVNEHELWAAGVYCYNRNDPSIETATGFEAPSYKPGVNLRRLYTINLSGPGTIRTVLNRSVGGSVNPSNRGPEYVP